MNVIGKRFIWVKNEFVVTSYYEYTGVTDELNLYYADAIDDSCGYKLRGLYTLKEILDNEILDWK